MNPKIDEYLVNEGNWKEELMVLRRILLERALTEDFKCRNSFYIF